MCPWLQADVYGLILIQRGYIMLPSFYMCLKYYMAWYPLAQGQWLGIAQRQGTPNPEQGGLGEFSFMENYHSSLGCGISDFILVTLKVPYAMQWAN